MPAQRPKRSSDQQQATSNKQLFPFHELSVASGDGTAIHVRRWLPASGAVRARVVLVHGLSEWGEPYTSVAPRFAEHGLALYLYDLRGHGRSGGHRMYLNSWEEYRQDASAVLAAARAEGPACPVFFAGISMGGLVVLNYAIHHPDALDGVIALGPAVGENGASRLLKLAVPLLSRLTPKLALDPKLDLSNLARDPEAVRKHITDPQYQVRVTARLGAEVLRVTDETRQRAGELRVPLLVLHGSADLITSPEGSRSFVEAAGSADKTFNLYEGGCHAMLLDDDRDGVVREIITWIDARPRAPRDSTGG